MTHPLVDYYLRDLDLALAGKDPGERADTLAAIREHLEQAVTDSSSGTDVERVLAELGTVESIAADVTPAAPHANAFEAPAALATSSGPATMLVVLGAIAVIISPLIFVSIPLALVTLIWSIVLLRKQAKGAAPRVGAGRLWTALALATVALFFAALVVFGLLAFDALKGTESGTVTVVGAGSTVTVQAQAVALRQVSQPPSRLCTE